MAFDTNAAIDAGSWTGREFDNININRKYDWVRKIESLTRSASLTLQDVNTDPGLMRLHLLVGDLSRNTFSQIVAEEAEMYIW